jgi:hypothetical protein
MAEPDKVMFEVYQAPYDMSYRVVYYTELEDHNKDDEIDRAMAGRTFYDGFIRGDVTEKAKEVIGGLIKRLNDGEDVGASELEKALSPYVP